MKRRTAPERKPYPFAIVFFLLFLVAGTLRGTGGTDALQAAAAPEAPSTVAAGEAEQALADPASVLPGVTPKEVERAAADCHTFADASGETLVEREVCGTMVRFHFSWPEGPDELTRLTEILKQQGNEILYTAEDAVTARRQVSGGLILWTALNPRGEDSRALLILQAILDPDRERVFSMDREDHKEVIFYTQHPGDRLMRLDITAPDADLSLEGEYGQKTGELSRRVSLDRDCYHVHGPLHEIGQVPQYAGL
ncbi:hypothetical protein SAMN02746041_03296, partial [Desulfacinum hydrothermale DSM 13146]